MKRCICILVTYRAERSILEETLRSLIPQVQGLVVIDNTPKNEADKIKLIFDDFLQSFKVDFHLIQLGENIGIAAAQNIGIDISKTLGAEFILFSDQDTKFPMGAVSELQKSFELLVEEGVRVACVGPSYINSHNRNYVENPLIECSSRQRPDIQERDLTEASFVISSGMLTTPDIIGAIGTLNAAYFIDWVDVEWCFRARKMGYLIYVCRNIKLRHRLGDKIHFLLGKEIVEHGSARSFYKIRNAIFLSKSSVVNGFGERIWLFKSVLFNLILLPMLCSPRVEHFKACIRGFWHGVFKAVDA